MLAPAEALLRGGRHVNTNAGYFRGSTSQHSIFLSDVRAGRHAALGPAHSGSCASVKANIIVPKMANLEFPSTDVLVGVTPPSAAQPAR